MDLLYLEPYFFRGRRGVGSEARRVARRREFRRFHRQDLGRTARPLRHGRRTYSRDALLVLKPSIAIVDEDADKGLFTVSSTELKSDRLSDALATNPIRDDVFGAGDVECLVDDLVEQSGKCCLKAPSDHSSQHCHAHAMIEAPTCLYGSPYCNWLELTSPLSADWMTHLSSNGLRLSSIFSGIGSEHFVAKMLLHSYSQSSTIPLKLEHTCTFEISKHARDVLALTSDCPLFGDVLSLLPPTVLAWARKRDRTVDELKRAIVLDRPLLAFSSHCYRTGVDVEVDLGDVVISGIPCVDFSNYGARLGLTGPTTILIMVWVRLMLMHMPMIIVVEEVGPFVKKCLPMLMKDDMLGKDYNFDFDMLDPRFLNLPVSRPRMYCILVRRDFVRFQRPFTELRSTLPDVTGFDGNSGLDYFFDDSSSPVLTAALNSNLDGYTARFGTRPCVYDLTQSPYKRPRTLLKDQSLPVITKSCRLYSTTARRLLTGVEALQAQGWPMEHSIPFYDARLRAHMSKLHPATTTSFAGNGMHLACLGLTLGWIFSYCGLLRQVPLPRVLHLPDLLLSDTAAHTFEPVLTSGSSQIGVVPAPAHPQTPTSTSHTPVQQLGSSDGMDFVRRLLDKIASIDSRFSRSCHVPARDSPTVPLSRRDLFPFPRLHTLPDYDVEACFGVDSALLLRFVDASLKALNYWYGYKPGTISEGYLNTVQRHCLKRWMLNAASILKALSDVPSNDLVARPPEISTLTASRIDVLDKCGQIDTESILPRHIVDTITDGAKLFPDITPAHAKLPRYRGDRAEYTKLVARQLAGRRVRLRLNIVGGGPCFFISKPGKDALRHLWNGHFVSDACLPAPPPRHLATPTTFVHLRATADRPVYLSTRDCRSWFEQLKVPDALRPYLGQQSVNCKQLIAAMGISIGDLRQYIDDLPSPLSDAHLLASPMFPVSYTWPQGFSWSPYIAQEKLLHLVEQAGFDSSRILSPSQPPPRCILTDQSTVALIYDDVMHFTRNREEGLRELALLDEVYKRENIEVAPSKDQSLVLDGLACGVELSKGVSLRPNIKKLRITWDRILSLIEIGACSPEDGLSINGTVQWFDLLARPKLAGYHHSYAFGRQTPLDGILPLPGHVAEEWCISLLLAPAWIIDLSSDISCNVIATDASTSYGLGVSRAHVDVDTVERLLSYDDKRGDYITTILESNAPEPRVRLGTPQSLPIAMDDFTDVVMIPWPERERPEVVELRAYIAGIKWLLRSARNVGKRQVFLLDSRVVLGAARKGRSSSPKLAFLMRRLSALLLLSGTLPHCLYIPTEYNPADAPSRGFRRHKGKRRGAHAKNPINLRSCRSIRHAHFTK